MKSHQFGFWTCYLCNGCTEAAFKLFPALILSQLKFFPPVRLEFWLIIEMKVKQVKWLPLVVLVVAIVKSMYQVNASFVPVDNYLIACGSTSNVSFQGNTYTPDSLQSSVLLKGSSIVASTNSRSVPSSILRFARIFSRVASYRFKIHQQGRHWIRLYFYPVIGSGQDLESASITVVTDHFVLLNDFTFKKYSGSYLFKEYAVNVTSDRLTITFIPLHNLVVFVNAIEVVSMPDELVPDRAWDLNSAAIFSGLSELSLETVYRLNMGGPLITPENDTMGRVWESNDRAYLIVDSYAWNVSVSSSLVTYRVHATPQIAPASVYATAEVMSHTFFNGNNNLSWRFPVNPDFLHLIRVHFCDFVGTARNLSTFNLFINQIPVARVDLRSLTGGLGIPYFKDLISNSSDGSFGTLTVSIIPDTNLDDAMLNGLEILKISNVAKSLYGVVSVENLHPASFSKPNKRVVIGCTVGAAVSVALAFLYAWLMVDKSKAPHVADWRSHSQSPENSNSSSAATKKMLTISQKTEATICIQLASSSIMKFFTFQEIMDATDGFDQNLLIGVGGFGRVYRGTLQDGTTVAVKRGNQTSDQGLAEFRNEIKMMSTLHHSHIVSLIGYCEEQDEMILVYEYMPKGALGSHLYGTDHPSLSWKQRLQICIGVARGIHYLHTGATQSIIHRDIKTSNILLDENFAAKVADFGLSKVLASLDQTHISTAVKGTFGYLDPEYFVRQKLTHKSDVYPFGVVLMEILCARPALNYDLSTEKVNIAWTVTWQKKDMSESIIDKNLLHKVNPNSLRRYAKVTEMCLAENGIDRPSMGEVLWNLEQALHAEEKSLNLIEGEDIIRNHLISRMQLSHLEQFDSSMSRTDSATDNDDEEAERSILG